MNQGKLMTTLSFLLGILSITTAYTQSSTPRLYQKGIYKAFEDFKKAIPTDTITQFIIKRSRDSIKFKFYDAKTEDRLKKEFAYSDGTNLYVSLKKMIKEFPREDRSQLKDDGNFCVKALKIGSKYIYFENYFTSKESVIIGGIIAGSAARRIKGIVYDVEKETFNLFKNALDFENFVKENHPEYLSLLQEKMVASPKKGSKVRRVKSVEDIDLIRKIIGETFNK